MARAKADVPEGQTLQGLGDLTLKQIQSELHQGSIAHKSKASKAQLVSLLALSGLGLVDKHHAADLALLLKVIEWCCYTVSNLKQEPLNAGIDKGANKWIYIENLIRAEFEDESDADDCDDDEPDNEPDDEATGSSSQVAISPTKLPAASVMNLLLASFYADMRSYSLQLSALPGCPVDKAADFLEIIDNIPSITDARQLVSICQQPKGERDRLISRLRSTFGSDITEATKESGLKVPSFGESVQQFVYPNSL